MTAVEKLIRAIHNAYLAQMPIVYLVTDEYDVVDEIARANIVPLYMLEDGKVKPASSADRAINIKKFPGTADSFPPDAAALKKVYNGSISAALPCLGIVENYHLYQSDSTICKYISSYLRAESSSYIRKSLLLLVSPVLKLPQGQEQYIEVVTPEPLDSDEIQQIIRGSDRKPPLDVYVSRLAEAFRGFNRTQILETLRKIKVEHGTIQEEDGAFKVIERQKERVISQSGVLFSEKKKDTEARGLYGLREWIGDCRLILENLTQAKELWKTEFPKGVLVVGLPGTGKSLMANETARILNVNLIRMDTGALQSKFVGDSEQNMRRALELAQSMAPCVLWIDELEKSFGGLDGSGDNGIMLRCFATFLTWMQKKESACFVFATANDISTLRPEFLRKGRFEEKFYTFMPMQDECIDIFSGIMASKNKPSKDHPGRTLFAPGVLSKAFLQGVLDFAGSHGKFMVGADIEGFINDAVRSVLLEQIRSGGQAPNASWLIGENAMRTALQQAIQLSRPYGATNKKEIALYWHDARKNNFRNAYESQKPAQGGRDALTEQVHALFGFDRFAVDGKTGQGVFQQTVPTGCSPYDARLFDCFKAEIERVYPDWVSSKNFQNRH